MNQRAMRPPGHRRLTRGVLAPWAMPRCADAIARGPASATVHSHDQESRLAADRDLSAFDRLAGAPRSRRSLEGRRKRQSPRNRWRSGPRSSSRRPVTGFAIRNAWLRANFASHWSLNELRVIASRSPRAIRRDTTGSAVTSSSRSTRRSRILATRSPSTRAARATVRTPSTALDLPR